MLRLHIEVLIAFNIFQQMEELISQKNPGIGEHAKYQSLDWKCSGKHAGLIQLVCIFVAAIMQLS